jgi:hypothetical protein
MSSEGTTKGIGPDSYKESASEDSNSSCLEDSRSDSSSDDGGDGGSVSDADCFSTISLECSTGPDESFVESGPAGFETVEGMELGLGGMEMGLEDSPECFELPIIKGEGGLTTHAPVMTTGQFQRGDPLHIYVLKMGWPFICRSTSKLLDGVAGIIQISAEIFWVKIAAGANVGKDCIKEVQRTPSIFN